MHRNALSFKELRIKDHTGAVLMADFRMQRSMTEHCHPVFVCLFGFCSEILGSDTMSLTVANQEFTQAVLEAAPVHGDLLVLQTGNTHE